MNYTPFEMMLISAARQIDNSDLIFSAFQWPTLAVYIAKQTHAPDVHFIYESGIVEDILTPTLPSSLSDPIIPPYSVYCGDSVDILMHLQGGYVDKTLIMAALIDKYGNVNTTCVGNYEKPKIRLPGGGGAPTIAACAKKIIWLLDEHSKRRFVDNIGFITDFGFGYGHDDRIKKGFMPNTGPHAVISPLGIMKFEKQSKEMYLAALHQGVSVEDVRNNTSWALKMSKKLKELDPPSDEELTICRKVIKEALRMRYNIPKKWIFE